MRTYWFVLRQEYGHAVGSDDFVVSDDGVSVLESLRDEQAVEWIAVRPGEGAYSQRSSKA